MDVMAEVEINGPFAGWVQEALPAMFVTLLKEVLI